MSPQGSAAPSVLRYDTAAWELLPNGPRPADQWTVVDVEAEIRKRGADALAADELLVDYYRIGYRLSFPLPVATRPAQWPQAVNGVPTYPWLIWLAWALEERWRALDNLDQVKRQPTGLVHRELAALDGWSSYDADSPGPGLVTATLANVIADHLEEPADCPEQAAMTRIAGRMLDESFVPAFVDEAPPADLRLVQNIRLITLVNAARLAYVLDHPAAEMLQDRATHTISTWLGMRQSGYSEGVGYDGYVAYHLLPWIATTLDTAQRRPYLDEIRRSCVSWAMSTLPGRPELQAPLGDTEPEMSFWLAVLVKVAAEHDEAALASWCRQVPLYALPSTGLTAALRLTQTQECDLPSAGVFRQPGRVVLRSGDWSAGTVVVIGTAAMPVGHLHYDGGHVVIGWEGRFWITDPGYQQYRSGTERDYTLDAAAHNAPVINGQPQNLRATRLVELEQNHLALDLSGCYAEISPGASVRRDVWLQDDQVIVRDQLGGIPASATVSWHWLIGTGFYLGFREGWARLTDAQHTLWFGSGDADLHAGQLDRHPGSRGPLTLSAHGSGPQTKWWYFATDSQNTWTTPTPVSIQRSRTSLDPNE